MEHSSLRGLVRPRKRCAKGLEYWAHTPRIFEFRKSFTKFLQIYRRQTPEDVFDRNYRGHRLRRGEPDFTEQCFVTWRLLCGEQNSLEYRKSQVA